MPYQFHNDLKSGSFERRWENRLVYTFPALCGYSCESYAGEDKGDELPSIVN